MEKPGSIAILDFGSQYTHLIGNRIRKLGAYTEIVPPETSLETLRDAAGIILSGGPQSVYDHASPQADTGIFDLGIPVLGLCYGLQWMTQALGGDVRAGKVKEYGRTRIRITNGGGVLLRDCGDACTVWMSHGDEAARMPEGFVRTATSDACENAAFENADRTLFALQFHPEVTHTEHGTEMLKRFTNACDHAPWSLENFARRIGEQILADVGDRKVFMLVSGGVDSTVAFTLLNEVLGIDRVQGLLVDTGLMRKNEVRDIRDAFARLGITNLRIEDASHAFLSKLAGVHEPEAKRAIIGDAFLAVQKTVSEEMGLSTDNGWMLGQGTIYPDTIETGGTRHADTIKTHHNRVPAVQAMIDAGLVIEPLKELYKDEVRILGEELGLPHELVWRHPFPGPGLGVRILCAKEPDVPDIALPVPSSALLPVRSVGVQGDNRTYRHALVLFSEDLSGDMDRFVEHATAIPNASPDINRVLVCLSHSSPVSFVCTPGTVTRERADLLRDADAIVDEEVRRGGLYERIWQFPVVLLPVGTQAGGQSIVLRPITSTDAMTADAFVLPEDVRTRFTQRLLALPGIDAVLLDLTNKPPGTIEWE